MPGHLFLIVGPSGSGKNTLIDRILTADYGVRYLPSVTTRSMRPGEAEGSPYHFVSEPEFAQMQATGQLLEWQLVHGSHYGSSRAVMQTALERGELGITDLDILGAYKVKAHNPEAVTTVFVIPSSLDELRRRIQARKSETPESLARRLQRVALETELAYAADYLVFNDDLEKAVAELGLAIQAALRQRRQGEYFGRNPAFRLLKLHLLDAGQEILYRSAPGVPRTVVSRWETGDQAAERLLKAVWWELFPETERFDLPKPVAMKPKDCYPEVDPETSTFYQVEERAVDLTGRGLLERVGRDGEMVFCLSEPVVPAR